MKTSVKAVLLTVAIALYGMGCGGSETRKKAEDSQITTAPGNAETTVTQTSVATGNVPTSAGEEITAQAPATIEGAAPAPSKGIECTLSFAETYTIKKVSYQIQDDGKVVFSASVACDKDIENPGKLYVFLATPEKLEALGLLPSDKTKLPTTAGESVESNYFTKLENADAAKQFIGIRFGVYDPVSGNRLLISTPDEKVKDGVRHDGIIKF